MFASRRDRLRRRAAAQLLGGDDATSSDPEYTRELHAMHALAEALDDLPGQAWSDIPARPPRRAGLLVAGGRSRFTAIAVAASLACLAAGIVVGENIGGTPGPGRAPQLSGSGAGQTVALHPLTDGSSASAVATMPAPGQMVLQVRRLPLSAPGTYYELWLMTNLHHLVPVAAFRVSSTMRERLSLTLPDDPGHYAYLDISVQKVGSGTAHSGDSVLRGDLT